MTIDRAMAKIKTKSTNLQNGQPDDQASVGPEAIILRAVPAAGGCSVSVIAIRKMAKPTDRAAAKQNFFTAGLSWGRAAKAGAQIESATSPMICPPTIFLGCAVADFGIAKMIKVLAPRAATIAAWVKISRK